MRLRTRELRLATLPAALDGFRIAHLSDFHLGVPSRGVRAVERAVSWVEERRPDLVCITGDLLSRPRAQERLQVLLDRLGHPYVVLGNHDFALSRDPFSRPVDLTQIEHGTVLLDASVVLDARGLRVELAGVDPRTWLDEGARRFDEPEADFRILLCHFPEALETMPAGRFDLILSGHLHGGQIVLPYGAGKLMLAHPAAPYSSGVYERGETTMHVSPGLGTTFVPFRLFARPEATELVLRSLEA